ncbi:hypothetical protein BsWGS_06126 [Bradybaena similaris]
MPNPRITWPVVSILGFICLTECVVLRDFRQQNRLEESNTSLKTTGRTDENHRPNHLPSPVFSKPSNNFTPTFQRCCQIGKRVAKKKMVCDITTLAVIRKYERQTSCPHCSKKPVKHLLRGRQNKLSEKISKCSAKHPRDFVKCCKEQEDFSKHMKKCELKSKRQKRRCKQLVKKKYS